MWVTLLGLIVTVFADGSLPSTVEFAKQHNESRLGSAAPMHGARPNHSELARHRHSIRSHPRSMLSALTGDARIYHKDKKAITARSSVVTGKCDECKGAVDYLSLVQASPTGAKSILTLFLLLAWIFMLLWLLNTTAQDYFVPPLKYWARTLHLTPQFAGATLVALGNGAPDLSYMLSITDDLDLLVGGLLGSAMCVVCFGGFLVIITCYFADADHDSKGTKKQPDKLDVRKYSDSLVAFTFNIAYIACVFKDGHVTLIEASIMPLLYLLYIIVLVMRSDGAPYEVEDLGPKRTRQSLDVPPLAGLARPTDAGVSKHVRWILVMPSYAIRWCLIPPADEYWDTWRRIAACSSLPTLAVACIMTDYCGMQDIGPKKQVAVFGTTCALGLLAYVNSSDGPEVPWFYPGITFISKVSSIIVISAIAQELIASLETLGFIQDVPRVFLGTIIIAWGNSIGDMVTLVAMVRSGQERMALTSIFAGPCFNIMVGAGISLALAASRNGGTVELWGISSRCRALVITSIGFLFAVCLVMMFFFKLSDSNQGPRLLPWSVTLLVCYMTFLGSLVVVQSSHTLV